MKKIFLLLTMSLTLSSFALNNAVNKVTESDDFGTCSYSIYTAHSDGSVTRDDYVTTAYNEEECQYIASNHATIQKLSGN